MKIFWIRFQRRSKNLFSIIWTVFSSIFIYSFLTELSKGIEYLQRCRWKRNWYVSSELHFLFWLSLSAFLGVKVMPIYSRSIQTILLFINLILKIWCRESFFGFKKNNPFTHLLWIVCEYYCSHQYIKIIFLYKKENPFPDIKEHVNIV